MSNVSASSLFHFTSNLDNLKGILEKGFRFSYCCEKIFTSVAENETHPQNNIHCQTNSIYTNFAIPMICFCDIPLTNARNHSDIYGKFIIGLNKDTALIVFHDSINPVWYRTSMEIRNSLEDLSVIKKSITDLSECHNISRSLNQIIGNTKQFRGSFRGKENYCFYDEREWRILRSSDYSYDSKWYWNIPEAKSKETIDKLNKTLHESEDAYRSFTCEFDHDDDFIEFITHIIVDTDENIPELVEFILNEKQPLFGYPTLSKRVRNLLVSKISSFERIKKDY